MEYWKNPMLDLSNRLVLIIRDKESEIEKSFSTNKTNLFSQLQNRSNDAADFRNKINVAVQHPNTIANFQKDFEKIKADIENIIP